MRGGSAAVGVGKETEGPMRQEQQALQQDTRLQRGTPLFLTERERERERARERERGEWDHTHAKDGVQCTVRAVFKLKVGHPEGT